MLHPVILNLTSAALSRVDRDQSTKAAAAVAAAVARGPGSPGLKRAAGFVADALAARQDVRARVPEQAPPGAAPGPAPSPVTSPPQGRARPAEEVTLRGTMDALNCGGFGFSLFNSSDLHVGKLGTDGAVGGQYDLTTFTPGRRTTLMGRGDEQPLPVQVRRTADGIVVTVGGVADPTDATAWALR
jgi:hypothetical protein